MLRKALATAVAFAGVALALGKHLRRYEIAELSMSPTLQPGDFVLTMRSYRGPLRGDIVVVTHPSRPGFELVKRVIGLPGEHIVVRNGRVYIDDTPLAESWADAATHPELSRRLGDEVFLLGDRRASSTADSRTIGPVPSGDATWRIVGRYWPPGRIARI